MQPQPTCKVELRFQCSGLTNMDTFSKSDPQVFVFNQIGNSAPVRIGNTEKINNSLNPQFKTPVFIDYFFEISQKLTLTVYDIDNGTFDKANDFIGTTQVSLASIVSSPGSTYRAPLLSARGHHAGYITVTGEVIRNTRQRIAFQMSGDHFDKKDLFGKSDPYYTISRNSPNGFVQVFKSEVHKNTLNPVFKSVELKMDDITGGDMKKEILFSFFDYDSVGKHDFIGSFCTNAEALVSSSNKFALINQKKKEKKSSYTNSGVVDITRAWVTNEPSFMDYLVGGCEISLVVGIDCTGSNLDPDNPESLHYNHPTIPNAYANAIVSIGNVLAPYDFDGMVPVFGFGAVLPSEKNYKSSDCFPMGLDQNNLYARGVEGILDVYYKNITKVSFSGPTNFAPLINNVAQMASETSQNNQKYTILLIITDGEIMDMEATITAIINASSKALSIVIVGVGSADFSSMIQLDGDDGLLSNSHSKASRDIVQFVAHRDFKDKPFHMLAEETLREIPAQLMAFMTSHGIKPHPPRVYVPPPQPLQPLQPQPEVASPVAQQAFIVGGQAPVPVPAPSPVQIETADLVNGVSNLEVDEQPEPEVEGPEIPPVCIAEQMERAPVSLEKRGIVTSPENPVVSLEKSYIEATVSPTSSS